MPLGMQGDKLFPGQQNIGGSGFGPRAPNRWSRNRALDAAEHVGKTAAGEVGQKVRPRRSVVVIQAETLGRMGKNVDQRAFQLLTVGVTEFSRSQLLEVVVENPGMIQRRLQHERFAPRDRGAMAAMQRARRKMRTRRDV